MGLEFEVEGAFWAEKFLEFWEDIWALLSEERLVRADRRRDGVEGVLGEFELIRSMGLLIVPGEPADGENLVPGCSTGCFTSIVKHF